jgi:hypothetical protein
MIAFHCFHELCGACQNLFAKKNRKIRAWEDYFFKIQLERSPISMPIGLHMKKKKISGSVPRV